MEDLHSNGKPPLTVREDPGNMSRQQAEIPPRRRVAAVSAPALSASRLTLPGVMDAEGRVDESRLRMHIFKNGGVSSSERGLAWRFLFGMYPCSSTALERSLLREQLLVHYQVMKRRWQQFLPSAVRMQLNGTDAELLAAVRYFDQREAQTQQQDQDQSEEVKDRLAFLELQAQILFERITFDLEELREATRIIDKDVPRTNRDLSYYQDEGLGNLLVLRDILITYAAFHPEVSYAQGMNDLCSRFLEVLDSEVDTFWSFSSYMEKFSRDFMADGLHRKIGFSMVLLLHLRTTRGDTRGESLENIWTLSFSLSIRLVNLYTTHCQAAFISSTSYMNAAYRPSLSFCTLKVSELEAALLKELDPPLYAHLVKDNMESFTFCHRWLLLGFQREFEHSDALRLFEILSCDHLELISQQVDRARYQERLDQKHYTEDRSESPRQTFNTDFTFELFICAAILLDNRECLLRCQDDVQLIQFTSSLQGKLDLNSTLEKAESHFYNYCKRCAWDYMNRHCRENSSKPEDFFYQLRSLFVLK